MEIVVVSYYNAPVCLFVSLQIGTAARCAAKRAMPTEGGSWSVFLGERHATPCPVAEERVKYFLARGMRRHFYSTPTP